MISIEEIFEVESVRKWLEFEEKLDFFNKKIEKIRRNCIKICF